LESLDKQTTHKPVCIDGTAFISPSLVYM